MTMREILFRGKRLYKNTWVYGGIRNEGGCFEILPEKGSCKITVYRDTVGQYTGVVDKGGNWIFEGDIIRAVLPETKSRREFVWPLMQIIFASGAFCAWDRQREFITLQSFSPSVLFEIVGNIHDNPELIGGESHG